MSRFGLIIMLLEAAGTNQLETCQYVCVRVRSLFQTLSIFVMYFKFSIEKKHFLNQIIVPCCCRCLCVSLSGEDASTKFTHRFGLDLGLPCRATPSAGASATPLRCRQSPARCREWCRGEVCIPQERRRRTPPLRVQSEHMAEQKAQVCIVGVGHERCWCQRFHGREANFLEVR